MQTSTEVNASLLFNRWFPTREPTYNNFQKPGSAAKARGKQERTSINISGLLTEESAYRPSSSSLLLLPRGREINSDSVSHTHVPSQQISWDSSNHTSKQQHKKKAVQILAVENKKKRSRPHVRQARKRKRVRSTREEPVLPQQRS
jgi:hypothetical protein